MAILVSTTSLMCIVSWQMRASAERSCWESTKTTLVLIENYLNNFLEINQNNISFLASLPEIQTAERIFPLFKDRSTESDYSKEKLSDKALYLSQLWKKLQQAHPSYAEIFSGYTDGSYGTSIDGIFSAGFFRH